MTKKQLKQLLIQIRNGAFITPILEKIWEIQAENAKLKMSTSFNCSSCTTVKEVARLKEELRLWEEK